MPAACRSSSRRRKQSLIVVNCGMPATAREDWRRHARATAAHSTVTFNDDIVGRASSNRRAFKRRARRLADGRRPAPRFGGARETAPIRSCCAPLTTAMPTRYGIMHERTIALAADGTRLEGEDLFLAADGGAQICAPAGSLCGALSSAPLDQGHLAHRRPGRGADDAEQGGVDLQRRRGARASLRTASISPATEGPRRTVQMVIYGHASRCRACIWSFQQSTPAAVAARGAPRARRATRAHVVSCRRPTCRSGTRPRQIWSQLSLFVFLD